MKTFPLKIKKRNARQSKCKQCFKSYNQIHYTLNKKHYAHEKKERIKQNRLWLFNLKQGLKCQRCKETDSRCLDFHHLDSSDKLGDIAFMIHFGYSKERILKEISKCIVLCSNCHRKETLPNTFVGIV